MKVILSVGDGRYGYSTAAPYDVIHVGASAAVIPEAVSWCNDTIIAGELKAI